MLKNPDMPSLEINGTGYQQQFEIEKEDVKLLIPKETASSAAVKKPRNMAWDNAKLILTVFVCTGHIIMFYGPQLWGHKPHDFCVAFWVWFHLFEMPGFVFISGYFSRSFANTDGTIVSLHARKLENTLSKILFVYINWIVFEHAFGAYNKLVMEDGEWWNPGKYWKHFFPEGVDQVPTPWLKPLDGEWYLLALFFWRCSVPFMHTVREPLAVAFIAAWIGGWMDWKDVSPIQRCFGYFPFFVLGLFAEEAYMKWLKVREVQIVCTIILFGSFPLVLWQLDHFFNISWNTLTFKESPHKMWLRPEYYFVTITMTFSFFGFIHMTMSNVHTFAKQSQATLYNYLLHMTVLKVVHWFWDWPAWFKALDSVPQALVAYILAVLVAILTTSPLCTYPFSFLISPDCHWLFKSRSLEAGTTCKDGFFGFTGAECCAVIGRCHKAVDAGYEWCMSKATECFSPSNEYGEARPGRADSVEPQESDLSSDINQRMPPISPAPRRSIM